MRNLVPVVRILIVAVAVTLAVARFLAIDATSHSASDTLRPWLIEVAIIAVVAGGLSLFVGRLGRRLRS